MTDPLKILIGFILGVISIYIKHLIDKKIEISKTKEKLNQLILLVNDSPPPEWIKTYTEPKLEIVYAALNQNGGNMAKFKSRIQAIDAYATEISKSIYTNLKTVDIIKYNGIKFWLESILRRINEDEERFKSLDFSSSKKLSSFRDYEKLSPEKLEEVKKITAIAQENQRQFESYIIETNLLFMMIKFSHQNMLEACKINDFSKLEYDYNYNKEG